jgi:hypothetical protein
MSRTPGREQVKNFSTLCEQSTGKSFVTFGRALLRRSASARDRYRGHSRSVEAAVDAEVSILEINAAVRFC